MKTRYALIAAALVALCGCTDPGDTCTRQAGHTWAMWMDTTNRDSNNRPIQERRCYECGVLQRRSVPDP